MNSESNTKNKYYNLICVLILTVFISIGFFAGMHHEAWADEAQSWLIARDTAFSGLYNMGRFEGTPPLWFFVIKVFQLFKLNYNYFFVISLITTTIGAVLLLFFIDISLISKVLILFSFMTIYQSTAISRSYSLVFAILMLIVLLYEKRFKRPYLYFLCVFLLSMTSSFGTVMAGSFMCLALMDIFISLRKKEKDKRIYFITFFICGALLILQTLYIMLSLDNVSFHPGNGGNTVFNIITRCFLFCTNNNILCIILFLLLSAVFILYFYYGKNIFNSLVLVLPLLLYLRIVSNNNWHLTNLYFITVTAFILFKPDFSTLKKPTKYVLQSSIIIILCSQVAFAGYDIYLDYKGSYSGSKAAADYITEYVEKGDTIYSVDYYGTAIQPYFDKNIYINHYGDSGYYFWSVNNNYWHVDNINNFAEFIDEKPKVIISHTNYDKNYDGYEQQIFDGSMYFKNSIAKDSVITVWVKK